HPLLRLQRAVGNRYVQRLVEQQRAGTARGRTATSAASGVRRALSGPGEPLGRDVLRLMQSRFGSDFSDVRIHRGADAAASARALGADAYTAGNRIAFGPGAYHPGSAAGQRVLAHELAHVIQQRGGPVSGVSAGGGVTVSRPGDSFERAAEHQARQVMARPAAAPAQAPAAAGAGAGAGERPATTPGPANPPGAMVRGRRGGTA